jgi:hypothetical protein
VVIAAVFAMWMGLCNRCMRGKHFAIGEEGSHGEPRRRTDQAAESRRSQDVGLVKSRKGYRQVKCKSVGGLRWYRCSVMVK